MLRLTVQAVDAEDGAAAAAGVHPTVKRRKIYGVPIDP